MAEQKRRKIELKKGGEIKKREKRKINCFVVWGSGGSDERVEPIFLRPLLVGSNHLRWESWWCCSSCKQLWGTGLPLLMVCGQRKISYSSIDTNSASSVTAAWKLNLQINSNKIIWGGFRIFNFSFMRWVWFVCLSCPICGHPPDNLVSWAVVEVCEAASGSLQLFWIAHIYTFHLALMPLATVGGSGSEAAWFPFHYIHFSGTHPHRFYTPPAAGWTKFHGQSRSSPSTFEFIYTNMQLIIKLNESKSLYIVYLSSKPAAPPISFKWHPHWMLILCNNMAVIPQF